MKAVGLWFDTVSMSMTLCLGLHWSVFKVQLNLRVIKVLNTESKMVKHKSQLSF